MTDHPLADAGLPARALDAMLEPAFALVLAWTAALGIIMHSDPLLATLVVLGAVGAFFAGLVGIGGAIVMVPMLVYLPPFIGTGSLSIHDVTAVTMVQVLASSASGAAGHARQGSVDRRLVVALGTAMMVGSFIGGIASHWMPAALLQGVFATMAAAAAVIMVAFTAPPAGADAPPPARVPSGVVALAGGVGLLSGSVGAGGAFLLIPLMLYVLKVPTRTVVGTSLVIVLAGAALGTTGKVMTGQVPGWPALALVAGSLPAAQLGASVSRRIRPRYLRRILALLVAGVAVKMWLEILT